MDRYLFCVVSGNRYLPRGSKENVLSATNTGNITMSRYVVQVVTILDFVIIAGSLESVNSSILAGQRLFKDLVGKKSGFYDN